MKIDYDEFKKQRAEEIRKSNTYCEYQCIFQAGEMSPLTTVAVVNVDDEEVAKLIKLMEENLKILKNKFPLADFLSKAMQADIKNTIETIKDDKE